MGVDDFDAAEFVSECMTQLRPSLAGVTSGGLRDAGYGFAEGFGRRGFEWMSPDAFAMCEKRGCVWVAPLVLAHASAGFIQNRRSLIHCAAGSPPKRL